jgi:hypothetical protein
MLLMLMGGLLLNTRPRQFTQAALFARTPTRLPRKLMPLSTAVVCSASVFLHADYT